MTSFTQVIMPWAFKLCLAKVTGPSLVYMTVGLRVNGKSMLPRAVTRVGLLATFDSPTDRISLLTRSCHQLRCLRAIRRSVSTKVFSNNVHAFVCSHIDYCNLLLIGSQRLGLPLCSL